jgi:hypothetical protein
MNLILFGSVIENMFRAEKQNFSFKIFISPPLGLTPRSGQQFEIF